jgi:general secretion pathway protein G
MRINLSYKTVVILLVLAAIMPGFGCAKRRVHQREEDLRKALLVLRSGIQQFTLDKRQSPQSLAELVSSGYMKEIPADPLTGKNGSWKVEKIGASLEVHSGSDGVASDGTKYSSWSRHWRN